MKKLLIIGAGLAALVVAVLFISTTIEKPVIADQYCKKVYSMAKQCVPGCVWKFHEDEFTGVEISVDIAPLAPKNAPTCEGR